MLEILMPTYLFHLVFDISNPSAATSQSNSDLRLASFPLSAAETTQNRDYSITEAEFKETNVSSKITSEEECPPGESNRPQVIDESGNFKPDVLSPDSTKATSSSADQPRESLRDNKDFQGSFRDWRLDHISIQSIDMESRTTEFASRSSNPGETADRSSNVAARGLAIKGKYIPTKPLNTDIGSGVIHLYRDTESSTILGGDENGGAPNAENVQQREAYVDDKCTTLCILAVPSYMTPSDLLGWVGEDARDDISHFRLIRASRSNKYMVLMKFREPSKAKRWQKDWNGKLFNSMEPENCHVVFVRSIQFKALDTNKDPSSFPDMTNDPFTPSQYQNSNHAPALDTAGRTTTALKTKPAPPPTPSLIELPTCPVCLERMDETNGLATIFCQHVFHCACLQKWKGSGCPVCRYTQDDIATRSKNTVTDGEQSECQECGSAQNLWICLICGHTGCGRYDEAHAREHFENTSHSFAMDISTQHIWDYVGDEYVHRLIQDKSNGKLVELPSSNAGNDNGPSSDVIPVPREKMENMSLEYTHLLTSQLDSQRMYFEEQVERAVDKAAKATSAAEQAAESAIKAASRLEALQESNHTITNETLPSLERDRERAEKRADRFEGMARKMEREWREKEVINESLMDRIKYLEKQGEELAMRNSDLEEQNRDLSFFISGTEKLKNQGDDVQDGTLSVADPPNQGKKKKKGSGKK